MTREQVVYTEFTENHRGSSNGIGYKDFLKSINIKLDWYGLKMFTTKDQCRLFSGKVFEDSSEDLVSNGKTVFVASNNEERHHYAKILLKHGFAEIIKGYKLMRYPIDEQMTIADLIKLQDEPIVIEPKFNTFDKVICTCVGLRDYALTLGKPYLVTDICNRDDRVYINILDDNHKKLIVTEEYFSRKRGQR